MLILKILGGLVALGVGIWLGTAREYRQSQSEIDKALTEDRGQQRVRRHWMWMDMFSRSQKTRTSQRGKRPFKF